jgi:hypothetical protein
MAAVIFQILEIGIEKERCYSQLNRFSQFNFQEENEEVVIHNLNQLVFELKFPSLQSSFNLTRHDLCKIDLQVGIINNLMPYWSGNVKLCPTQKYHVPLGLRPRGT